MDGFELKPPPPVAVPALPPAILTLACGKDRRCGAVISSGDAWLDVKPNEWVLVAPIVLVAIPPPPPFVLLLVLLAYPMATCDAWLVRQATDVAGRLFRGNW